MITLLARLEGRRQTFNLQTEYAMTAKLILRGKEFQVKSGITVQNALKKAGINSESVLATRDGELITDDEILREDDVIKLVEVISGG
jgi:sulfur carrier protein ThiS